MPKVVQKTSAICSADSLHPPSSHLIAASNIAPIKKYTRYLSTELCGMEPASASSISVVSTFSLDE